MPERYPGYNRYQLEYYHAHKQPAIARVRRWRAANPDKVRQYARMNREKYREKYRARDRMRKAMLRGQIPGAPQGCQDCGKEVALHAHHDDYSKPLEVRWLCPACHHTIH